MERDMDPRELTLQEMCARFGVTPRTLRHYESVELLSPRREGRRRYYGPREVARLTLILRGRRFGFSLEEIRQWLLIYGREGSAAQIRAFLDMADRRLAELAEERARLDETIRALQALRDSTAAGGKGGPGEAR